MRILRRALLWIGESSLMLRRTANKLLDTISIERKRTHDIVDVCWGVEGVRCYVLHGHCVWLWIGVLPPRKSISYAQYYIVLLKLTSRILLSKDMLSSRSQRVESIYNVIIIELK